MHYFTQGIILRKTNWGETGQFFSIYTKDLGKIEVVGRGTKKIKSKLNSHLQFFSLVDIAIAKGKNFSQLTGALLSQNFTNIKSDLVKIALASFGLELVDKLTQPHQPDKKIFDLLLNYLEIIDKESPLEVNNFELIKKHFIIKLTTFLGYQPSAEIITDAIKLDAFLKRHLEKDLQTEKLLKLLPLTSD